MGDNETRIKRIRSQIEDSIEKPENKSRYLPFRQSAIEQFVSKTIVSINKKNRENLWAIEVTTADRPGILAVIGESFKKFDIEIVSARITTLGEKVEDIFYVSSNSISLGLEQSKADQLKLALRESLDNHAQKLMNKK